MESNAFHTKAPLYLKLLRKIHICEFTVLIFGNFQRK